MIEDEIRSKLELRFPRAQIKVENESHMHSVPKNSETHFKVVVVSPDFEGKRLLGRHRIINELLKEEITKIRAMSLHTFTQEEWESSPQNPQSPTCVGGSKMNSL